MRRQKSRLSGQKGFVLVYMAATLTTMRTVHGLVFARGKVGSRYVAFATDRTTYFHEADSALGFSQLNDPGYVTGPASFQQAASHISFAFNWAYIDAKHTAYFQSGAYPVRAPGTSPDFPILARSVTTRCTSRGHTRCRSTAP